MFKIAAERDVTDAQRNLLKCIIDILFRAMKNISSSYSSNLPIREMMKIFMQLAQYYYFEREDIASAEPII